MWLGTSSCRRSREGNKTLSSPRSQVPFLHGLAFDGMIFLQVGHDSVGCGVDSMMTGPTHEYL